MKSAITYIEKQETSVMNIFNFFTPKADTLYLTENATIRQALEKFDFHKFTVVPLLSDDGHFMTTVSEGDILRYIKNQAKFDIKLAENAVLSEIEKYRPYRACRYGASIRDVLNLALEQNFVPLVDDRGYYIGIIKRKAILSMLYEKIDIDAVYEISENN